MATISKLVAREILDSRGNPTIETSCVLSDGSTGVASVPSGASTGAHEALELRDEDPTRYSGKGVLKAVENVNSTISRALIGMDAFDQKSLDKKMIDLDATENKTRLGANAMLSVSLSVAKASSVSQNLPLYVYFRNMANGPFGIKTNDYKIPTPLFNMVNGGAHGAGNLDFQEFFVIPASFKPYDIALRSCVEIYHTIGKTLEKRGAIHSVGDEGGYAPNLFTNADALEVVVEAIREAKYEIGRDVFLGLDVAASQLFKNGNYTIRDKPTPLSETAMIDYYKNLNDQYHLALVEDPLSEDAWEGWKNLYKVLGGSLIMVGDDLLTTNAKRVAKAIEEKVCNAILIKPNQIGTLSETLTVIRMAKDAGWKIVVSHRSGETNDWLIADLAVGVGADFVKFGAPSRGERVSKYNRLMAIFNDIVPHGSK